MWRLDFGGRAVRVWLIAALAATLPLTGANRLGGWAAAAPPAGGRPSVPSSRSAGRDAVLPGDDWTFRPTVMVRRGTSQGTGTVIASVDGETLVLTAAHVVRGRDPLIIELHRYNLGLENRDAPGPWPRVIPAQVAASDPTADVAILRVRKMEALPYVARILDSGKDGAPEEWSSVTSVGIDLGSRLSSWNSVLVETARIKLGESDQTRPFLITARTPEHGRSGGGLFTAEGRLIGVCVGHAEMVKGRRMGVFSSIDNARRLIRENDLTAVLARSSARHAARRRTAAAPAQTERPTPELIPTDARETESGSPPD